MSGFQFHQTEIPGLLEIEPFYEGDLRGGFIKDYSQEIFQANGLRHDLAEVFYTVSHAGVVRGLHFQRERQQPKLVRCIHGQVFDAVVDLRKDSPAFMRWLGFDLSGDNRREILVPSGCAHGYLVLTESVVSYKCSEKFYPEFDDGILWNDPDLRVEWPLDAIGGAERVILAGKDKSLQTFRQFMDAYGGF